MDSKIETIAKAIVAFIIEKDHVEFVEDEIASWNTRVMAVGHTMPMMKAQRTMIALNEKMAAARIAKATAKKFAEQLMETATEDELKAADVLVKTQYTMFGHPNYIKSTYTDRYSH